MSYGLPTGTNITYGAKGFPPWVYEVANAFGLKASTYRGHQESDRNEAGFARNPQRLNRGIDWSGPVDAMQRFAEYLLSIRTELEQVIWQNPRDGRRVGVAGGKDVTASGYYSADYGGHTDHVHTRQSNPIPLPNTGGTMTWTGDPTWLADTVKPAVEKFRTLPGWDGAGHGDFKDIRGVMVHHTGNARESAESIRRGRPDLEGPLANIHIAPDGTVTIVAVGVCWHAGVGSYPWLPTNMGNWHMIGIELAYPFDTSLTAATAYREPWPRAQVIALRNTVAAILLRGNLGPDRVIGHKDYAGRAQGKWDPGNMAVVGWLQDEVRKDMEGFVFPGESGPRPVPPVTPPPVPPPAPPPDNTADVLLHYGMQGLAVIKLQTRLQRNYSRLVVDGVFGRDTEAKVRDYQRLHHLDPDGVVGPLTAQSLGLVL
jgi:hypothetical protein